MRNKPNAVGTEGALAKMPGGASGMPSPQGQIVPPTPTPFLGRGVGPKAKRYRVLNGGMVMFNNARTALRAGKEVSELCYDIAGLKKQGIKLELIADESEEPEETFAPDPVPTTAG